MEPEKEEQESIENILGMAFSPNTLVKSTNPADIVPVPVSVTGGSEVDGDQHSEEDYRAIRKNLKGIIEKSEEAVDRILDLAQEGEEPRAYEVVADLLRTNMEANEKLIGLHKQRKELQKKAAADAPKIGSVTNNNNTIIATTTELLDIINKNRKKIAQQDIIDQAEKSKPK